jgi:hypothetical protein
MNASAQVPAAGQGGGPDSSVVQGQARFQVLTPNLVRLEYSPARKFIDAPTVSVVKRAWAPVLVQKRQSNGFLEIDTGKMTLRYRMDSGPFKAENLQIRWHDEQGDHAWKPGDKDDKNLGGVPGDIAERVVPGNETGPLSRNGYYLLDDSTSAVWDKANEWVKPRPEKNNQDWYFFVYGRDFKGMLGTLAQLVGPIPMVPRYVLGTWFGSRTGYSADQWKMIASRFREESIPLDVLVLDSNSACKVIWSGYGWDYEQMPDPKEFFAWMRRKGLRVTLNEHYEPLTPVSFPGFEKLRQWMGLPEGTKEIRHNLADKKYAEAFMNMMHKEALDDGMAFWWQDGNAPADMPGLDPVLWTRYIEYAGSERITGQRAFVFGRLGPPPWPTFPPPVSKPAWGVHRYGTFFTGDLMPYWSTLDLLIPFDVQAANMLVGYVNNLMAGVFEATVDPEIYQRWMQFSLFSPVYWPHGIWGLRLPWEYGAPGLETAHKYMDLRYRLLPYLYTYARLAHDTGNSLVRGMYIEYPQQEPAYTYRHQYLFGQELLVAPISEPGYGKSVLKDIYLPAGDDWFDYFTGKIYAGGQVINYEAPLERIPLFVRAGSILPMAPKMNFSEEKPVDPLTLDVYTGKPALFQLYEDDGTSLDYLHGASAWTPLRYTPQDAGAHRLEIGPVQGQFRGQLKTRRYEIRWHGLLKPETVIVNGEKLEEKPAPDCGAGCGGWTWDNSTGVAEIRLVQPLPVGEKTVVEVQGTGSFADAVLLQKVVEFRERLRQVKIAEKLKYAILLQGGDHSKPPRVIRETEKVETELDKLVASPKELAQNPPDFRGMTTHVLKAFTDRPFESQRQIPAADQTDLDSTKLIADAVFEPWEIRDMTFTLLGCEIHAKASGAPSPTLLAKLVYDTGTIGPAKIDYEIALPEAGLPGWMMTSRSMAPEGYAQFGVRVPFPPDRGSHTLRVKATLTWEGGKTEAWRDVEWFSTGLPKELELRNH